MTPTDTNEVRGRESDHDPGSHIAIPHERALVIGIIALSGLIVAWWSRDFWFYADIWDFLSMRSAGNLDDVLRPHFGHWQTPAMLQTRLLYSIGGMEYWPVYHLPRLLWWGAFTYFAWSFMRRRGASPIWALGAVAVLSVLGTSGYFQSAHVGALIAITCLHLAGAFVETHQNPGHRQRLILWLLLVTALMSNAQGVPILLGITLALALTRRLLRWLLPLAAAGAVYGAWFLYYDLLNHPAVPRSRMGLDIIPAMGANLRNTIQATLGTPGLLSWIALGGVVAALGWLVYTRRVKVHDVAATAAALTYIALQSVVRVGTERDSVATNVLLMLIPVVVPHLPSPRRRLSFALVALLLVGLTTSHVIRLESGLQDREQIILSGRPTVERIATLIAEGEQPYLGSLQVRDLTSSSQMTLDGIARLVAGGWASERPTVLDDSGMPVADAAMQAEIEATALLRLRASLWSEDTEGSPPVATDRRVGEDSCARAPLGETLTLWVKGPATVQVRVGRGPRTALLVSWSDEYATVDSRLFPVTNAPRDLTLFGPLPDGALVTLRADPDSGVVVCGVIGPDDPPLEDGPG